MICTPRQIYDLYPSPNMIRIIKSRRMRQAVHLARMRDRGGELRVLFRRSEGRRPL